MRAVTHGEERRAGGYDPPPPPPPPPPSRAQHALMAGAAGAVPA